MTKFDPKKPVQTRDGKPARIVSTKIEGGYPIGAIVSYPDGKEVFISCTEEGCFDPKELDHEFNLVNVPEKQTRWVNIYHNNDDVVILHPDKESADYYSNSARVACIKIEFEEGQGL